ncbi:hypothetical protein LA52FAK_06960 [Desulforhopalus sp. 52FAK]
MSLILCGIAFINILHRNIEMKDNGDKITTETRVLLVKPYFAIIYIGSKAIEDNGSNKNA